MFLDKNTIHHESILLVSNFKGGNIWDFAKNIDNNFKKSNSKKFTIEFNKDDFSNLFLLKNEIDDFLQNQKFNFCDLNLAISKIPNCENSFKFALELTYITDIFSAETNFSIGFEKLENGLNFLVYDNESEHYSNKIWFGFLLK